MPINTVMSHYVIEKYEIHYEIQFIVSCCAQNREMEPVK